MLSYNTFQYLTYNTFQYLIPYYIASASLIKQYLTMFYTILYSLFYYTYYVISVL